MCLVPYHPNVIQLTAPANKTTAKLEITPHDPNTFPDEIIDQVRPIFNSEATLLKPKVDKFEWDLMVEQIDFLKLCTIPSKEFLEKHQPNWVEMYEKQGCVELEFPDGCITTKIDIRGLSKMVNRVRRHLDNDPGQAMVEVLKKLLEHLEQFLPPDSYMISLEGDAVNIVYPLKDSTNQNVQRAMSEVGSFFQQFISELLITHPDLQLPEDETDLKVVMVIDDGKTPADRTKTMLYKGGLSLVEQPMLDAYGTAAETLAKRGGATTVVLSNQDIGPKLHQTLRTRMSVNKFDTDVFAYQVFAFDSLFGQTLELAVLTAASKTTTEQESGFINKAYADVQAAVYRHLPEFKAVDNVTLAQAECLAIMRLLKNAGKNTAIENLWASLAAHFSETALSNLMRHKTAIDQAQNTTVLAGADPKPLTEKSTLAEVYEQLMVQIRQMSYRPLSPFMKAS